MTLKNSRFEYACGFGLYLYCWRLVRYSSFVDARTVMALPLLMKFMAITQDILEDLLCGEHNVLVICTSRTTFM